MRLHANLQVVYLCLHDSLAADYTFPLRVLRVERRADEMFASQVKVALHV